MAKKQQNQKSPSSSSGHQFDGLRSLRLELENFKNITKAVIDIGGRSLLIMGRNNVGKSSIIQAMMSPMDSKLLPSEPIKAGEERAKISHKIGGNIDGEYHEYTMDIHFSPKNLTGRLVIYDKVGAEVKSPASKIKGIIGNVSFDVTKWLNDTKAKKLETIKNLTGCGKEIDLINNEIKRLKEDKNYKSERADSLSGTVENNEFTNEEKDYYSVPVDVAPLQQELAGIAKNQEVWDSVNMKTQGFQKEIERADQAITRSEGEIFRLQQLIEAEMLKITDEEQSIVKNTENVNKGLAWLQAKPRPSVDEVSQKISDAVAHNEKYNRIVMLGGQKKEEMSLKREVEEIKSNIEKKEQERSSIISSSQLPIEGLSFSDEEIYLNGLPLEENQINTAGLISIGVDIAIALNPRLKMIFLSEGSLMDSHTLKAVIKKIEDNNYMAVAEIVAENSEVECVFAEDYL